MTKPPWEPLKPVTWFLGLEMLNGLRGIVLDAVQHDFNLRDWMTAGDPPDWSNRQELWFDFLADIGDGGRSMGSLAYHLQRPITIASTSSTERNPTSQIADGGNPALAGRTLPRGDFLFIGGDYAYPKSDKRTFEQRVIAPFAATRPDDSTAPLAIYGIPANHDYYDDLIGFNRAMRTPVARGHRSGPKTIDGFQQSQSASYVRLRLPHEWELWGVDVGTDGIDFRQLLHLRPPDAKRPRRLIVCTQKPPIVFDRVHTDDAHKEALAMLALSSKFEVLASAPAAELGECLDCRLDLSGDVHHYARYGAETKTADGIPSHQFAGVVSGAGGAFLHPTWFTTSTSITPQKKYPTPQECTRRLASGLLNFFKMLVSGQAWILAGLIALAIYAGSESWSGILTALPHRLVGGPTMPYAIPWPDLAMTIGIVSAIGLPFLWFAGVRPLLLGKRFSKRVFGEAWPSPKSFGESIDSWKRAYGRAGWRDALDRDPRRALLWVSFQIPLVLGLALAPPWLAAHYVPGASTSGVLAILGVLLLIAGGIGVGFTASNVLLGIVHASAQVTLPLAAMLYRSVGGLLAVVALFAVCSLVVVGLGRTVKSETPPRVFTAFTTLLWVVQWLLAILILAWFAPPIDQTLTVATGLAAVAAGVIVCVHQFGWYLFVAYLWGGHNNESGAAIRCEDYKQWIRFHLGSDGVLTGYVIGIDKAVDPRTTVAAAKIVDVFQIEPS